MVGKTFQGGSQSSRRAGRLASVLLATALSATAASAQVAPPAGPPPAGAAAKPKLLAELPAAAPGSRPPSPDPRNLEGVYVGQRTMLAMDSLPLTAKAKADRAMDRQRTAEGKPTGGLASICRPQPTLTLGARLFPGEIVQTADQVILLNEEHRTRVVVYLDRDHPKDLKPSYFGDSVGHWEGDTLVIDTIGFNGRDRTITSKAHLVTRVRKIDGGRRLEIKITYDDPATFTEPVVQTTYSAWNPDVQMLEFQCEENMEGAKEGLNIAE